MGSRSGVAGEASGCDGALEEGAGVGACSTSDDGGAEGRGW